MLGGLGSYVQLGGLSGALAVAALLGLRLSCGGAESNTSQLSPARGPRLTPTEAADPRETAQPTKSPSAKSPGAKTPGVRTPTPVRDPASAKLPEFELPAHIDTSKIVEVEVPSDLRVRVLHAPAPVRRAIVYLHGMCSSSTPADRWAKLAAAYGTLVLLRAETPCGSRPGNKWTKDTAILQARIDRALEAVKAARGGHLDTETLGMIGYSQGAHRAEILAGAYPHRYPHLVLGGPPEAALPENFKNAQRVVILGGELENTAHMRLGADRLRESGVDVRFFTLPRAYHGDYGPEGVRVMKDVLAWVFRTTSP
jgi:pimeloyl-ACP methyl ester carboxylesterase